jgi:hypothetical protein
MQFHAIQMRCGGRGWAMLIQGAFMHVGAAFTADRFLKFLANAAPQGHYFVAHPPPGVIMTAAIDWRVILPDRDSIEALATALWSGYESLVQPQGESQDKNPLIFIQIKNVKGECDQFTIGKDVDKRDAFVHRVRESAAILASKNRESALRQEIERTTGSDYWLKLC